MGAFILSKGGSPQEHESPPVARQGFGNARAWTGLEHYETATTHTRWAAYAAQRRLRRKRSGCRWPVVVMT